MGYFVFCVLYIDQIITLRDAARFDKQLFDTIQNEDLSIIAS